MTEPFDPDDEFEPFDPGQFDPYEDLTDLTGGDPVPPLEDASVPIATPPRSPLLTGLIVLLILVVLSIAAFQFLREDEPTVDAGTTTTTVVDDTAATATTSPDATPATTAAVTTEPAPGGTGAYGPVGEPIPIADLGLAVDAIGSIALGSPAAEAIGRLIATFGEPDEDTGPVTSTGTFGACAGETERIVRFGPLATVVVIDADGTETFAGYRLDLAFGGLSHPAASLETLSGLAAGNSIRQLRQTYEAFDVDILSHPDPDIDNIFELRSRNTGNLLLWGPVSSPEDDGFVRGIYSPDACDRF